MYLKSIRLDGFKSFCEKTVFEFNKGITAIVGPNGSGKSNIVDAVRWVLGEQSVKSLRGGNSMSDVIFSGSEYKEALNKASVTLTFDNSDNYLKSDFKEIEVKRTVYKNGENEYFINNSKVRLKDINDLFIDSNSGIDSFNIISQGTVADIVNYKPYERRFFIESAAGVLKYKKRKEESLKKLSQTEDNLSSINLLVDELALQVNPLKEQASLAKHYLELKEELKTAEISLTAKDITNLNKEYLQLKKEEEDLTVKLSLMNKNNNTEKCEKLKLDIYKLDDKISTENKKLLSLTEEISLLSSEKRIALERVKYDYSEDKITNNLINLKEEELNLIKALEVCNDKIDLLNNNIKEKEKINNDTNSELISIKTKKNSYSEELADLNKQKLIIENKIEILENNIMNNERMPLSVKNILNNDRLKGIHNTLGNIIEIKDLFLEAFDVVLGSSSNFIIVESEVCAKEAINYLKDKKIGYATFLPLNIIKSRYISSDTIKKISTIKGFVGVASDLINYDSKYKNIVENQLGNVIVANDIDAMNIIAKALDYKYRVVSLDGSIIYAGGIISGGSKNKSNNLSLKNELHSYQEKLEGLNFKITDIQNKLTEINSDYQILENNINKIKGELINLYNDKESKMNNLQDMDDKLKLIKNDIEGMNNLQDNKLSEKLDNIMNKLNVLSIEKEKSEQKLNTYKDEKTSLNDSLNDLENESSKINSAYKMTASELNNVSVNVGKLNVKLDNLLLLLNEEYGMTYEFAKENYDLDIDDDVTRKKVQTLKSEIKSLGEINIGSINEFERVNTRYEFLVKQKEDLETSMASLKNVILEMDNIMKEKFKNTFQKVSEEFSKVFKIMFQGGTGKLELTAPNDYLNTGIEMIIVPPGKKIHNTQSLSGGEKSLTAICLLFAILNVSPVPFIILDEVEAALDEVNVDLFGEYLNKKKNDSQYILITHKKRMMEYADVLYGVTMQNAGVSKVVGVELQNI